MIFYIKNGQVVLGSEYEINIDHDSAIECQDDETVVIDSGSGEPVIVKNTDLQLPGNIAENLQKFEVRAQLRSQIAEFADSQSLLGTTADASAILLVGLSGLVLRLNEAETVADVNNAADVFLPIAQQVLNGLADGSVNFPYREKPDGQAIAEILERSTAVAGVIRGGA